MVVSVGWFQTFANLYLGHICFTKHPLKFGSHLAGQWTLKQKFELYFPYYKYEKPQKVESLAIGQVRLVLGSRHDTKYLFAIKSQLHWLWPSPPHAGAWRRVGPPGRASSRAGVLFGSLGSPLGGAMCGWNTVNSCELLKATGSGRRLENHWLAKTSYANRL